MKTLHITTHWTTEEAACVIDALDTFKTVIWETYGKDITKMYVDIAEHQHQQSEQFDDELGF